VRPWHCGEPEPQIDERPSGAHAQGLLLAAATPDMRARAGGCVADVGHVLSG
jgi:hypothetical protein